MGWNKNLDYEETYKALRFALTSKSAEMKRYQRQDKKMKLAILLIALRNGSRISEAIDAFKVFIIDKNREQKIRTRKRGFAYVRSADGKRKRATNGKVPDNPVLRLMIIPDEISDKYPQFMVPVSAISAWCRREFNFNPHSLRYCFITYHSKKGISAQLIAKMTAHATVGS